MIDEILNLAGNIVGAFFTHRRAVTEKSWDELTLALDKLGELSAQHVKAVAEVTAPIIGKGDLIETSRRYSLLANNPDFPSGYDAIRGVLVATRNIPAFRDPPFQEKVRAVIDELYKFQYGVFTLAWDSYRVANAFSDAALIAAREQPSGSEIARVAAPFINTFTGLFEEISGNSEPPPPETVADLISLLARWCQSWQRYVQKTLYGGEGLNSKISQVKMQRFV